MTILILDDDISRVKEFTQRTGFLPRHVFTVTDFIKAIEEYVPDIIILDHDLGDDQVNGTGNDAARWLAHNKIGTGDYQISVIIWSLNPIGVANMVNHLKHADHINCNVIPFGWAKVRMKDSNLEFTI